MFGIENYSAFVLAGILLNITPGNDSIYIISRSIAEGRKAGIVSVCGIGCGAIVHIAFAAFGLSAVLAASTFAYTAVRIMGAAYLVYIGISMLRRRAAGVIDAETPRGRRSYTRILRQGFLTNLLNPKVALFFVSFLPQFVQPNNTHGPIPFLILGFTFLTTGMIWCFFLAWSAATLSRTLRKKSRVAECAAASSCFRGFGLPWTGNGN
jgi:threonine/homoserine/homoserine lactone efflux protein